MVAESVFPGRVLNAVKSKAEGLRAHSSILVGVKFVLQVIV